MKEPTENQIQADFFSWLALHEKRYPELALFYAIPNGSHKSPAARGLFQRTGLKAGVPDVHLPVESGILKSPIYDELYSGLWIEFKSRKGRLSEAQIWWIEKLRSENHFVSVSRSWTDAANITIEYLGLNLPKL